MFVRSSGEWETRGEENPSGREEPEISAENERDRVGVARRALRGREGKRFKRRGGAVVCAGCCSFRCACRKAMSASMRGTNGRENKKTEERNKERRKKGTYIKQPTGLSSNRNRWFHLLHGTATPFYHYPFLKTHCYPTRPNRRDVHATPVAFFRVVES